MKSLLFLLLLLVFCGPVRAADSSFSVNVMAPLTIGDVHAPEGAASWAEWNRFERQLRLAKALGARAVSTDLWWGLIEAREGVYDWAYYDKVATTIERAGLRWAPILSFHQLGGNVGDEGNIPPPDWIWSKYVGEEGVRDQDALKFKSEQGRVSGESVSVWGTRFVIQDYARFMREFQAHFAARASMISEITLGLGPAGELRYPSYNAHDVNTGYGTRGGLQAYSDLAVRSFIDFVRSKYHSLANLNAAWGTKLESLEQARPPRPRSLDTRFFPQGLEHSPYGRDFFDWYNQSLLDHGRLLLETSVQIFNAPDAAFRGIALGGKIPGIHWRVATDRLAELAAGLIRTSDAGLNSDEGGHGYARTLEMFKSIEQTSGAPHVTLHFTALEMDDGRDAPEIGSRAKSLVSWIGRYSARIGLDVKGENALAGELADPSAWRHMKDALSNQHYSGLTILRLGPLLANPVARQGLEALAKGGAMPALRCEGIFTGHR